MSNKKNDKWMQVGNFQLGIEKNRDFSFVVCRSVAKNWSVRWREDTMMFAMMMNIMTKADDENVKEYLHSLITVMFISTSYLHDLFALATKHEMPFCEGVAKLLKEQADYEESLNEPPSDEEDEKALKEVVGMQEIQDELEKLDKEQ